MKSLVCVLALGIVSVAAAQKPLTPAPLPQKGEGSRKSRVDAIMGFASDRMTTQIDVAFDDGDYLQVIGLLKVQVEMFPADYDLWTNLGWMQENVEDYDAALATYVRFRKGNPKDPDAPFPEANFYFMKKRYAMVPPILEPTIKEPCHANTFRILARSYEKLNRLADAARVYKALVARDDDAQAKANLKRVEGKIQAGTGKG